MNLLKSAVIFVALAAVLCAAGIDGKYKGTVTLPNGDTRENTMTLKTDGEMVSGSIASQMGESKFDNGTVKGDEVAFTVVRNFGGDDITFHYKGKVSGDKIVFKVSAGERQFEMTAVKQ